MTDAERRLEGDEWKAKLKQVVGDGLLEAALQEFNRRAEKTNLRGRLVLEDLIWDYQAGRWPKKRNARRPR